MVEDRGCLGDVHLNADSEPSHCSVSLCDIECIILSMSVQDEEDSIAKTLEPHFSLPEDRLLLHQQYVVRVRAKKQDLPNAEWSDWSEYSWTSAVGQKPHTSGNTHLSDAH